MQVDLVDISFYCFIIKRKIEMLAHYFFEKISSSAGIINQNEIGLQLKLLQFS